MQDDDANAGVRVAILGYLAHNNDAADTVRGIMNWWLPANDRNVDSENVERVLADLVAEGLVTMTRLADGTLFYRRHVK